MKHDVHGEHGTSIGETFQEILARRIARRAFLQGAIAGGSLLVVGLSLFNLRRGNSGRTADGLQFSPIALEAVEKPERG